jgi:hypothetical protein
MHVRWQMIWHAKRIVEINSDVIFTIYCLHIRWQMIWHTKRFEEIDWRCQVYYLLHEYSVVKDLACKENRRDC